MRSFWRLSALCLVCAASAACVGSAPSAGNGPGEDAGTAEARVVLYEEVEALIQDARVQPPPDLAAAGDRRAAWDRWLARHRADLDARLLRGDEDSVVNLMLYGTSFTSVRRTTPQDLPPLGSPPGVNGVLDRRLDDLARGLLEPGMNERLQFVRQVVERRGIVLSGAGGTQAVRAYLADIRARVFEEAATYRARLEAATQASAADKRAGYATAYLDRGLSSDTSIRVDFAIERVLEELRAAGTLTRNGVRRAAVIGPGLDFTDKADGHDFYPQQTTQPLALVDSLLRLELSRQDEVRVAAFDVNPRVIRHIEAARASAQAGGSYRVHLPLASAVPPRDWNPQLVAYRHRLGDQVGTAATPAPVPGTASGIDVRAVDVGPRAMLSVVPHRLDVVSERIDHLPSGEQFDVVVATNVLLYYGVFEQALAAANIARMLKPGGLLIVNHAVAFPGGFEPAPHLVTSVPFERLLIGQASLWTTGDSFYCYRRL